MVVEDGILVISSTVDDLAVVVGAAVVDSTVVNGSAVVDGSSVVDSMVGAVFFIVLAHPPNFVDEDPLQICALPSY